MKKILSESEAVPTVSINFGYFIETKFMLFTGEIYMNFATNEKRYYIRIKARN